MNSTFGDSGDEQQVKSVNVVVTEIHSRANFILALGDRNLFIKIAIIFIF